MALPDIVQQGVLAAAQQMVRAALQLDPGSRFRLQQLAGQIIAFQIRETGDTVFICPLDDSVELMSDCRVAVDVLVSGNALDLVSLLRGLFDLEADGHTLVVEGDRELLKNLVAISSDLQIDWEGAIAPLTGDVLAHQIGKNTRATEKWVLQSLQEVRRLAEEYMEEELPVVKESAAMKPVFEGLDKLKVVGQSLREEVADKVSDSPLADFAETVSALRNQDKQT